jgi:hypothetical protein
MCPKEREEFFNSIVKKMSKGKTNKERREFRRTIKEAKKDGSYSALVNEVVNGLVERGRACPTFHSDFESWVAEIENTP